MTPPADALDRTRAALLAMAVALLAAVPFWQTADHGFALLDDDLYVAGNERVQEGLTPGGVLWAFTTFHAGNWHPLTWLSHMADVSLFGARPGPHHAVNVALHALNAALLFLALRRMTGAAWRSAAAAALFAVHPLHVESVAWLAERKDLLSGLFLALALLAYARYVERPGGGRYLAVAALLSMGLMAKPMLVTVPLLLLLLDAWPLGRTRLAAPARGGAGGPVPPSRLLMEKIPLLLLAAASCAATVAAQAAGEALVPSETIPAGERAANAAAAWGAYLAKAAWPASLAVYYPHPGGSLPAWKVAASVALLSVLTAGALAAWRRRPYLAAGWFWFLGTLVPVIGLVQVGGQAMADRYTYIPLTGIFIALVWGVSDAFPARRGRTAFLAAAALGAVVALAAASHRRAALWKDGAALLESSLRAAGESWLVRNNLGTALAEAGRRDEAIAHFREALRLRPGYAEAHNNLALALAAGGRPAEAVAHLREAIRIRPGVPEIHFNLARVLTGLGESDGAVSRYREAIRIRPGYADAHNNLGVVLAGQGRFEEAAEQFREALRSRPGFQEARFNLGLALERLGRPAEAAVHYREAIRLDPADGNARARLEGLESRSR